LINWSTINFLKKFLLIGIINSIDNVLRVLSGVKKKFKVEK
jgi:hypothetical protein